MFNSIVAVQHGHREQDRAELPDSEKGCGGLRRRWQDDRDPVALRDPARGGVCAAWFARSCSSPHPSSRVEPSKLSQIIAGLLRGVLVADVGGDVVPRRHLPAMFCTDLVVAHMAHRYSLSLATSRG